MTRRKRRPYHCIDNKFSSDEKIAKLTDIQELMFRRMIEFCADKRTDGRLTEKQARDLYNPYNPTTGTVTLVLDAKDVAKWTPDGQPVITQRVLRRARVVSPLCTVGALVEHGVITKTDNGGYHLPTYFNWQEPREVIENREEKDAQRKRESRARELMPDEESAKLSGRTFAGQSPLELKLKKPLGLAKGADAATNAQPVANQPPDDSSKTESLGMSDIGGIIGEAVGPLVNQGTESPEVAEPQGPWESIRTPEEFFARVENLGWSAERTMVATKTVAGLLYVKPITYMEFKDGVDIAMDEADFTDAEALAKAIKSQREDLPEYANAVTNFTSIVKSLDYPPNMVKKYHELVKLMNAKQAITREDIEQAIKGITSEPEVEIKAGLIAYRLACSRIKDASVRSAFGLDPINDASRGRVNGSPRSSRYQDWEPVPPRTDKEREETARAAREHRPECMKSDDETH